jgi:peptide-methionine (S)-S-oxide reductase
MLFGRQKQTLPAPDQALPGRDAEMPVAGAHAVLGTPMQGPFPDGLEQIVVGMGLLLGRRADLLAGARRLHHRGGLRGGITPNPTYEEVCSGRTGHNEVVLVVFDPEQITREQILKLFWRTTTRPRACASATTWAPSTARAST